MSLEERAGQIRAAAWAERLLKGGASDDSREIGLSTEEMYRSGFREIAGPARPQTQEEQVAAVGAMWAPGMERKDDCDQDQAYIVDHTIAAGIVRNPELRHIFHGTAADFDTLHELQKVISEGVRNAYRAGYAQRMTDERQASAETEV